ncbi:MAG TPA: c-type cytochrome [Solirubrobacteraceae bacterium]
MTRARGWFVIAACGLVTFAFAAIAHAEQPPPQPFAPAWGRLAGWDVFTKKSCGQCHSVRGVGGKVGPDLARVQSGTGFYELGAAMWNHLPKMGERMREQRIERPRLTAADVSNLLAFLFTAAYGEETGDPRAGEQLFAAKGCAQCHAVAGKGGGVGPALDALKGANSPVLVAAAMWNHGPRMAEVMKAKGIERPTFKDRELLDIVAYVVGTARDADTATTQVIPGTPERGRKLFAEKHCAACHAVAGRGGKVGPALGTRAHHVSLTEFAGLMWNHGPAMWNRMKERGIVVPQLTGQDMADIVAYLYTSHYFDTVTGQASRGQQLVQGKGCLTCHSVRGKGGKVAADFATSTVVSSPSGVIAAMWNHGARMESQAQKQDVELPVLTGQELADVSAYLASLGRAPRPKAK